MSPIGLRLPDGTYGYEMTDVVELAKRAESLGYRSVWVAESEGLNGFMTLGRIAAETSEVSLGTGVVNVYSRTPALLAMSAATLDHLSGGRTVLGLAASSRTAVEGWHGLDYDRPLRRIRETIEIVRAIVRNERVDYDGEVFSLDDYARGFDTVREDVPVFNAALGATNRRLTGEYADGWLPVHVPRREFAEQVSEVEAAARAAGRDADDVTVAPYVVACVDEDAEAARGHVRDLLSFYLGALEYYGHVFTRLGFADAVEAVREAWADGDRAEAARRVPDALLDEVAVAGTPAEGRRRLREYRELGADVPVVYPPPAPRDVVETTVEELATY